MKFLKASALLARGIDFLRPRVGANGEGERARRLLLSWGCMMAAAAVAAPLDILNDGEYTLGNTDVPDHARKCTRRLLMSGRFSAIDTIDGLVGDNIRLKGWRVGYESFGE